jgi:cytochrome c oxidase assembly protein subunit 15
MRIDSILEYAHRVLAALASLSIVAAAVAGWRRTRAIRWLRWPPTIAVVFLLVVIVLGAMVVLRGLTPGLAALDLGSALLVLALMLLSTVIAFARRSNPALPDRLSYPSSYARLALWTLLAVWVVLVSAVVVADSGSVTRCLGWPLFSERLFRGDLHGWLQMARWLAGIAAGLLIVAVVVQAWRKQRQQKAILYAATVVGMLFLAETIVGAVLMINGSSVSLWTVYAALAAALWTVMVILFVLAGLASQPSRAERLHQPRSRGDDGAR